MVENKPETAEADRKRENGGSQAQLIYELKKKRNLHEQERDELIVLILLLHNVQTQNF